MNKKTIISAAVCVLSLTAANYSAAQTYVQTPVTVSKEKVRGGDGKLYWSHVVMEKQTLFSIAKAYGVTVDDICKANPESHLQTEGLKKNTILLIPVTGTASKQETAAKPADTKNQDTRQADPKKKDDYTIHVAKWYEDIEDIAFKYSVPKDILMAYNGLSSPKLKSRQKIRIPSAEKVNEMVASKKYSHATHETAPVKTEKAETPHETVQEENANSWNLKFSNATVNALLMLPMKASTSSPSESNMDFYSGVLLAVRHLAEQNIDTDLSVYDVAGGVQVTADRLRHSDFAIGPISSQDMAKVLGIAPESTYIISPLDHKTASLVPSHRNLIQAPASQESQYLDLLKWIREERRSGDRIMVITEKGARATSGTALMDRLITESGLPYVTYSYNILQGRSAADAMTAHLTKSGTTRVIINSESEAFVNDVVRNLDMLVYRKNDVVLYSSSKIRSFETIDVENLHNLKTRISTAYYIDYSSESVKRFLMEYRALYGTEPTQFAFQGYDLAYFFIKEKAAFGKRWVDDICRKGDTHMMQTDLMFKRTEDGGIVNNAVRRIVYGPDYSIKIVKR